MGGKGYLVRHIDEVEPVPCYCGASTRVLPSSLGLAANLHVTHITDSRKHYHQGCDEIYYILEGKGTIELEDEQFPLRPGTVIYIPAGVRHRGYGDFRTIVVGVPPLEHGDEFFRPGD